MWMSVNPVNQVLGIASVLSCTWMLLLRCTRPISPPPLQAVPRLGFVVHRGVVIRASNHFVHITSFPPQANNVFHTFRLFFFVRARLKQMFHNYASCQKRSLAFSPPPFSSHVTYRGLFFLYGWEPEPWLCMQMQPSVCHATLSLSACPHTSPEGVQSSRLHSYFHFEGSEKSGHIYDVLALFAFLWIADFSCSFAINCS